MFEEGCEGEVGRDKEHHVTKCRITMNLGLRCSLAKAHGGCLQGSGYFISVAEKAAAR